MVGDGQTKPGTCKSAITTLFTHSLRPCRDHFHDSCCFRRLDSTLNTLTVILRLPTLLYYSRCTTVAVAVVEFLYHSQFTHIHSLSPVLVVMMKSKGTRDLKIYSHAHSLILYHSQFTCAHSQPSLLPRRRPLILVLRSVQLSLLQRPKGRVRAKVRSISCCPTAISCCPTAMWSLHVTAEYYNAAVSCFTAMLSLLSVTILLYRFHC